jgi:FkbM family methyltransferase
MRSDAPRVPAAVRAWDALPRFPGHGHVALALANRLIDPERAYRTTAGHLFRADPRDPFQLEMLLGRYDPVLDSIVSEYVDEGAEVVDGGAHLGHLTLRLARAVGPTGRVHAFECDPRLAGRLREHVDLNGLEQVRVNELALFDRDDANVTLHVTDQLGWSSVAGEMWDVSGQSTVQAVTLDGYAARAGIDAGRLGFVKVDLEGAELAALRGMRATLEATRAAVLVEYMPWRLAYAGEDPAALPELMGSLGFEAFSPRLSPHGELELEPGVQAAAGRDVLFLKR